MTNQTNEKMKYSSFLSVVQLKNCIISVEFALIKTKKHASTSFQACYTWTKCWPDNLDRRWIWPRVFVLSRAKTQPISTKICNVESGKMHCAFNQKRSNPIQIRDSVPISNMHFQQTQICVILITHNFNSFVLICIADLWIKFDDTERFFLNEMNTHTHVLANKQGDRMEEKKSLWSTNARYTY